MNNSEEHPPNEERILSQDLYNRTEFLNEILRRWFHHLTALERLAVMFVYDRTCGWNKEWERITVNQFTQGVFGFDEEEGGFECYAAPFSKDRTGAQKVINRLIEKGAILRRDIPGDPKGCKEYSLNEDWDYPTIKVPARVVKMNASKMRRYELAKAARKEKAAKNRERKKPEKEEP